MGATFYSQVLRSFDWEAVKVEAEANVDYDDMSDLVIGRCYLGTVFAIVPSSKYYTPWACSNVTEAEAERDSRYYEALDKAAEKFGGWIESGEGDPCDLFFGMNVREANDTDRRLFWECDGQSSPWLCDGNKCEECIL